MTIRAGMTSLVAQLRLMTDADAAEFAIGSETYWSDAHLQTELDENRLDVYREQLEPTVTYDSVNNPQYLDYYWSLPNVEEANGGTAVWLLQNSSGSTIGTADYTAEYSARHIRFNTSTQAIIYFLTYRGYDLNGAAEAVWRKKAANVAGRFDVETDNHKLSRSQLRQSYLDMANYFHRQSGSRSKQMNRTDAL
jgi:hypothetical protein